MYFVLPGYIPPRPLGEAGVRKHWSTKYTGFTVWQYNMIHYNRHPNPDIYPPCPLPEAGLREIVFVKFLQSPVACHKLLYLIFIPFKASFLDSYFIVCYLLYCSIFCFPVFVTLNFLFLTFHLLWTFFRIPFLFRPVGFVNLAIFWNSFPISFACFLFFLLLHINLSTRCLKGVRKQMKQCSST